jgi:nucleotide-binding universal stress UspA family protein
MTATPHGGSGAAVSPPRRILVPVDFEAGSRRAVRYARALASAAHAEICLLHVVPSPPGYVPPASDRWWTRLAEKTLAGVVERSRLPPATESCVVHGMVATAVAEYAASHKIDLIILSGRRMPDWHGSLIGHTATAIVRHARVPVLIVPGLGARACAPRPAMREKRPA